MLANHPLQRVVTFHHHPLEDAGVIGVGPDKVKVIADITQQDGPRRALRRKHFTSLLLEFPHLRAHHRLVKPFLALEVIIEQGFVHAGGGGNGVGARPARPCSA